MTTLGDIVNEVHLNLLGYVSDQEQLTTLTASLSDSATTFTVADASQISSGLVEIDEELLWVTNSSVDTGVVTVAVRGLYGTTAGTHASGAIVRNAPRFPRASISRAVNDVIRSSYPDLFAVTTTTITAERATMTYGIPVDVEEVLDVTWQDSGPSATWFPVRRYEVDLHANTAAFATGKTINIFDTVPPGRTIQIVYTKAPSTLTSLTSDLSTTGLQESAKECLVYGTCARMVGYLEPASLSDSAAQAQMFQDISPPGAMLAAARYFYQLYLQAKAEEARRLRDRHTARVHWNR